MGSREGNRETSRTWGTFWLAPLGKVFGPAIGKLGQGQGERRRGRCPRPREQQAAWSLQEGRCGADGWRAHRAGGRVCARSVQYRCEVRSVGQRACVCCVCECVSAHGADVCYMGSRGVVWGADVCAHETLCVYAG